MKVTPVKKTNVSDSVVNQLVALIKEGTLRPGSRLPPERELMRQFGVGRSSVREAVRALAIAGILESATKRGTVVVSSVGNHLTDDLERTIHYWAIKDLLEVRAVLESYAAAKAAESATAAQIEEIEAAHLALIRRTQVNLSYFTENSQFHLAVAKASNNSALVYCLSSIIGTFREDCERIDAIESVPKNDIRDHEAVLKAIQARNPGNARTLMERHLHNVIALLPPPGEDRTPNETSYPDAPSATTR